MLLCDIFLCIIYISKDSESVKFATYNLKFRIVIPPFILILNTALISTVVMEPEDKSVLRQKLAIEPHSE
jgi:tellurite resistance protein TehA-like permease